ncbi:hypothetical protein DdX_16623 [Ditylenchus destructor]|uniref:Uncharacterized protein n=1 Tax=Ditylenchus destructor TaxID=166010 RepID=A0AAD4MQJ7_9BILA|nr:hypothetical protein DdX_16623 [Ditylenchus destructor]
MNSTNKISSEIEYARYLNLGYDIATAVFHVTTIFCTFHIVYCSKFGNKSTKLDRISNSFFIFLVSRGLGAVLATPYYVYLTVDWSAEAGKNYEPYALLWLGVGMVVHGCLPILSALLLTLERCLALTFPMHYKPRIEKWFPWFTLTCFIFWSIFLAFNVLREIPLDVEKVHYCQIVLCVTLKYRFLVPIYAKFGIGGLNVLGSCYLIFAIKRNNSEKLKNDVVKFTITMDIFLEVIPNFASFMFLAVRTFLQATSQARTKKNNPIRLQPY